MNKRLILLLLSSLLVTNVLAKPVEPARNKDGSFAGYSVNFSAARNGQPSRLSRHRFSNSNRRNLSPSPRRNLFNSSRIGPPM